MFRNTLTGLSEREEEVFDAVCVHLNGVMNQMGIRDLDGEEDQILIDLWMDMFPYKTNEKGEVITRTVKTIERRRINGKWVAFEVEKTVKELDFEHSLIDSTSTRIYMWRGEQMLQNKIKYLYGDKRVPKKDSQGNVIMKTVTDSFGNEYKRIDYEEEIDKNKKVKRDIGKNIRECELTPEGSEDTITLADVASCIEEGYAECDLLSTIQPVCDVIEMRVVRQFMEGDSMNRIFDDFEKEHIKFSYRRMQKLKEKLAAILRPLYPQFAK